MALTKATYSMIAGSPVNVLDFGTNTTPGVTDMTTALQNAVTAAQTLGSQLYIPEILGITAQINITSKIELVFAAGAKLVALAGFPTPTYSGGDITNVTWMLKIDGANAAGTTIHNANLDGSTKAGGILINNTNNVKVFNGLILNMNGPGTYIISSDYCTVDSVTYNLCGVDAAATDTGSVFTTTLRNDNGTSVLFTGNRIVKSGGKGIALSSCPYGIVSNNYVIDCLESYGTPYYAAVATDCKFIGNIGIQGYDAAASGAMVCKISVDCVNVSLENNQFYQYDDFDILIIEDNDNTFVKENTLQTYFSTVTNRQAIRFATAGGGATGATNVKIIGNTFYGMGVGTAIAAEQGPVSILSNEFRNWNQAIQVVAGGTVRSNSFISCNIEQLFGGSTPTQSEYNRLVWKINSDAATDGNAGSFSLGNCTLPANTIDRTGVVRVCMAGTKTGSAGNKTVSFRIGTTDITFNPAANDTNDWSCEVLIANTLVGGVTWTQRIRTLGWNGTTAFQSFSTANEDTETALFVGPRVVIANAGDVVTLKMLTVELVGP